MKAKFNQRVHLGGVIYEKDKIYEIDKQILDACYPCCTPILGPPMTTEKKTPVCFNMDRRVIYPIDGYGRLNRFFDGFLEFDPTSDILVVCSTPYIFGVLPEWLTKNKKIILFTMFEGTPLPRQWIEPMAKKCVAIITPSTFCKKLYRAEKALDHIPVYVVPLYTRFFKDLKPQRSDVLTFGMENAFIEGKQKGWDLIIEAFEELNLPNAKLILKSRHSHYAYNDMEYMSRAQKNKNIEVILADYTDEEMIDKFYSRLDCFLFPSRGEGFGLPPLQAMGFGIPTILTDGHGMKDFAKFGIRVRVKHKKYPTFYVNRVLDNTQGINWVQPDIEDLKLKMRYVYANWEQEKARALVMLPALKKLYSPKVFIKGLNDAVMSYKKTLCV